MKALVCGGRDYTDYVALSKFLRAARYQDQPITAVIHGGARGADSLAAQWAEREGIPALRVDANWTRYGKGAGPIRNKWMLDLCAPDVVIAFPGGSGTANMVKQSRAAGVHTHVVGGN